MKERTLIEIYRRALPSHPRLGRHVNLDSRSKRYALQPRAVPVVSKRHKSYIDILDQGNYGSCTGNASVACAYREPFIPAAYYPNWRYTPDQIGAQGWYARNTQLDPFKGTWRPDDTGSDGLTSCKVGVEAGIITGYRAALDLDSSLVALMTSPGITGIPWYESMFSPDFSGLMTVDLKSGLSGGHELCVDEVVVPGAPGNGTGKVLVGGPNSWGSSWGGKGRWYLTAADWWSLRRDEGDVYFWTPDSTPAPTPTPTPDPDNVAGNVLWAATREWSKARHVGANAKAAKAVSAWATQTGRRA